MEAGMRDTNFTGLMRRPTGFLPVAMSLAALAIVLLHLALFGAARESDEGTAAHLWRLLLAGQLPLVVVFAVAWLPRNPKAALGVLAIQGLAGLAAMAPVFLLGL